MRVDSGYAHPTLYVPMVDSFQAHHICGEADSVNARQTQGEDKAPPSLKPSNEVSSDRPRTGPRKDADQEREVGPSGHKVAGHVGGAEYHPPPATQGGC